MDLNYILVSANQIQRAIFILLTLLYFMKIKQSKTEVEKEVNEFFKNIKNKSSKEIKKIKRLAMTKNVGLKEKRKLFCGKCLTPYSGKEKIRIKNGKKNIKCLNCGGVGRWKVTNHLKKFLQ